MHGRPRLPPGQSPDHSKDDGRAKKLNSLLENVLQNHHERCYTKEALKQSGQALELNPEFYTAWNYRKLAVRHFMDSEPDEAVRKRFLEDELRMVEKALQTNIKSYGAWHHRRWIIGLGYSSLDHEFLLLQKLLKIDSRNFHGWTHRRFCVKANKVTPEKELKYATEKINENFSNYSAWHYRSILLSQLVNKGVSKEKILEDEYELVNQAYFTEPDDQSAWFYNTWLLRESKIDSSARLGRTWPLHGSTVFADTDKKSSTIHLRSQSPVDVEYSFSSEGLPVVLAFNDGVTDVVVQISCNPELGHLRDIHWRSLSSVDRPSKIWLAELPIQGCPEGEYGFSMKITSKSGLCQETEIKFNLRVSVGNAFRAEDVSNANIKHRQGEGACFWPERILKNDEKQERRDRSKQDHGQPVSACNLFSEEDSQKKTVVDNVEWQQRLLEKQIRNLRELLDLEPDRWLHSLSVGRFVRKTVYKSIFSLLRTFETDDLLMLCFCSKWAKLTLSKVLLEQGDRTHNNGQDVNEVLGLLKELIQLDPDHMAYYESLHSSLLIAKVLRNSNDLKQLWWEPGKTDSDHLEAFGWLRWNGLSLSKFDSFERLLWVQRLDLSDNQLRSIDGVEAMQLLVALDVSNNLIPNVASLAPLRLNPRLRLLNISHNEIGSHPVDSSRYSFPSALTNQKLLFPEERELHQVILFEDQWEVQAVFGGLELRVVEILGNVAANNILFRQALVRALPSLELLDGEQVQ